MQRRKAIWYGGLSGTYFLSLIEMLDGKSEKWGASYGDLLSNIAGSMLAISQDFFWDDQKIIEKSCPEKKSLNESTSFSRIKPGYGFFLFNVFFIYFPLFVYIS